MSWDNYMVGADAAAKLDLGIPKLKLDLASLTGPTMTPQELKALDRALAPAEMKIVDDYDIAQNAKAEADSAAAGFKPTVTFQDGKLGARAAVSSTPIADKARAAAAKVTTVVEETPAWQVGLAALGLGAVGLGIYRMSHGAKTEVA